MRRYVYLSEQGYPTGGGQTVEPALPDGAVELPEGVTLGAAMLMRLDGEAWVARPSLPEPVPTANGMEIPDVPDGTTAEARDIGDGSLVASATATNGALSLSLPADCAVTIEVTPPLPWLPREIKAERGAGSAALQAAPLIKARHAATMQKVDFLIALAKAGMLTVAQVEAWLTVGTLPTPVLNMLADIQNVQTRTERRLWLIGFSEIGRMHPLVSLIAARAGWTDAQIDAAFGVQSP